MSEHKSTFLQSARCRAEEKGMDIEMYLCKQISLSAEALERVREQRERTSREAAAADWDIIEIQDASSRLQSQLEAENEA
jgi:hypothetical protein